MLRWVQNRNWLVEISLTLSAAAIFGTTDFLLQGFDAMLTSLAFTLSFIFARRLSLLMIPVVLGASYLAYYFETGPLFGELAPVMALTIAAGLVATRSFRILQAVAILIGLLFHAFWLVESESLKLSIPGVTPELATLVAYFAAFDFVLVLVTSGYVLGRYTLFRQGHVGSTKDVAFLQEFSDENQLRAAELENRMSVASDVSELIVQNISAVISRAEGGIYAAKANPESATRSLERVLENAQTANQEVRRLVDLLRVSRNVSTAPPGLGDLDALAMRYRELGFSVRYQNEGKSVTLSVGAQLAVYRIVFETLRWFSDSAPKGTELAIDLIWSENGLQVLLKDNSIATANRANSKSSEADVAYEIADDVKALVEPIENPMIATARQRASIYGGSAEMVRVPGVGLTLSAYFPDLRLIAEHPEQ